MKLCPRCSTENAGDTDFCVVCGEYLRWEPTRAVEAVKQADGTAEPAPEEREHIGAPERSPRSSAPAWHGPRR